MENRCCLTGHFGRWWINGWIWLHSKGCVGSLAHICFLCQIKFIPCKKKEKSIVWIGSFTATPTVLSPVFDWEMMAGMTNYVRYFRLEWFPPLLSDFVSTAVHSGKLSFLSKGCWETAWTNFTGLRRVTYLLHQNELFSRPKSNGEIANRVYLFGLSLWGKWSVFQAPFLILTFSTTTPAKFIFSACKMYPKLDNSKECLKSL